MYGISLLTATEVGVLTTLLVSMTIMGFSERLRLGAGTVWIAPVSQHSLNLRDFVHGKRL